MFCPESPTLCPILDPTHSRLLKSVLKICTHVNGFPINLSWIFETKYRYVFPWRKIFCKKKKNVKYRYFIVWHNCFNSEYGRPNNWDLNLANCEFFIYFLADRVVTGNNTSGVWTWRQTGQVGSSHWARQPEWNYKNKHNYLYSAHQTCAPEFQQSKIN